MEIKKNPDVDVKNWRTIFALSGLAVALGLSLAILHYKQYDKVETATLDMDYSEEEIDVEQTVQEPEPVKPPPAPPVLEVVEDEVELEEQPEIEETEVDENEVIAPPPVIVDEIDNSNEVFESWDVSEQAAFKGGKKKMYEFIGNNLVYPPIAQEEGIQGRVTVEFTVEADGTIKRNSIKILGRKLGFGCDEAAIDVVSKMSGLWQPAKQRDKSVRMKFRLPIRFQIQ